MAGFKEAVIITANNIKVALPPYSARTATLDQLAFNAQMTSIGRAKFNRVYLRRRASVNVRPTAVRINFNYDYGHPPILLIGSHNPMIYDRGFYARVGGFGGSATVGKFKPTATDNVKTPSSSTSILQSGCIHANVFSSYATVYNWDVNDFQPIGATTVVDWMTLV